MEISIADQIALDDALVAPADRLKIGKCNLRLSSDVTSKEATLQVVYDVLKLTPFYKAFQFAEPPLEKEILAFLASLGHSGDIGRSTGVNVKKTASNLELICCYHQQNVSVEQFLQRQKEAREAIRYNTKQSALPQGKEVWKRKAGKTTGGGLSLRRIYKNDVNETTQDDEDDDDHDDDEKVQDDDDEEQTESEDDGDDFVHPKLTTHDDDIIHEEETDEDDSFDPTIHTPSRISSSDDEDSDNEVEGANVEGAKSDEDATYEEDQGNEAVEDTNTDLDGRDDVMTDVILPQVQATQEIEDTHVTLTSVKIEVNTDSSVSSASSPNADPTKITVTERKAVDRCSPIERLGVQKKKVRKRPTSPVLQCETDNTTAGRLPVQDLRAQKVYKATTKKLDWINPEGRQYPHDLRQPLPLVPNSQGRHVIPFHHFINNDLEYLRGGESSHKYSTSVTKTTATDYRHIKWIEDLVPNSMWSQMIVKYDKFALWGILHWGKKRRQFYAFATSRESARDVYSKRRIIAVTKVDRVEWQNYKHLDWITVRRDDNILYKFKEGDFHRLRIQAIEDMLLLLVQGKVTNLNVEERIAFNVSLRMFTRSVVIQRRVEDLQLGVESVTTVT
ncbi:hypothetical protein Tco_1266487 [Tanacetum coccineum]